MKKAFRIGIFSSLFAGLLILGAIPRAEAANLSASTSGELQAVLTIAATNGEDDTITIEPGFYSTGANMGNPFTYASNLSESLTIIGSGRDDTILDGGGIGGTQVMVLTPTGAESSVEIRDLTIQNGDSALTDLDNAGGLTVDGTTTMITVDGCDFIQNHTGSLIPERGGGGVALLVTTGGEITFTNNIVERNTSDQDSGGAHFFLLQGNATVTGNTFEDNTAITNQGGLRLFVGQGDFTVNDNFFTRNTAGNNNGGLGIFGGTGGGEFNNNNFLENDATNDFGGANVISGLGTVSMDSNTFTKNRAGGSFGGIRVALAGLDLGGIFNNDDAGAGLIFTNNVLDQNLAQTASAGATLNSFNQVNIINNTFYANNTAGNGGGLTITPSLLTGFNIYNNIFYLNQAGGIGDDILGNDDGGPLGGIDLFNNDFNQFCFTTGECNPNILATDIGGNINADPLFMNANLGDFRLQEGSPAVDAGTDSAPDLPTTDHNGDPRPQGNSPDMGAFESAFSAGGGGGCSLKGNTPPSFFWSSILMILGFHLMRRLCHQTDS